MVINGRKLEEFDIEVGVRQGCVLSPTLFSILFDGLVRELRAQALGVRYYDLDAQGGGNDLIGSLFYADDIVLLAESDTDLQRMIDKVVHYSKRWRFELSTKKTKVVVYGRGEPEAAAEDSFYVAKDALEVCKFYKYLGMEVEAGAQMESWKKFRQRMVKKATKVMRASWGMGVQSGCMSVRGGERMWKAFARPILEYGAEIWEQERGNQWDEAERVQN